MEVTLRTNVEISVNVIYVLPTYTLLPYVRR